VPSVLPIVRRGDDQLTGLGCVGIHLCIKDLRCPGDHIIPLYFELITWCFDSRLRFWKNIWERIQRGEWSLMCGRHEGLAPTFVSLSY
jgi:hypothetical protein